MSNVNPGEYFEYRIPSKFIGEIQIIFSLIIFVSGITSIVSFSSQLESKLGQDRDIVVGYITYSSVTVIVAITDIIFAAILISAANKISLVRCLLWRGSAIATVCLFALLSICFMAILNWIILLGFIPTIIFKPFALWVVNGFIDELRQLENFPSGELPPVKPTFNLQNPQLKRQLKRTTTIFTATRAATRDDRRFIMTSKVSSIPEEINDL